MFAILSLLATGFVLNGVLAEYPKPPPTLDPKPYTVWNKNYKDSRVGFIDVPFLNEADGSEDNVHLYRLDLVGNAYERGFAHGQLMAEEIIYFVNVAMNKYLIGEIMKVDLSKYPEPLQKLLKVVQVKAAAAEPAAAQAALQWVYDNEFKYMPAYLVEEMDAIGEGICSTMGADCDSTKMAQMVKNINMFPELIKMACSEFGAWGEASASGSLLQLRALDLGGGPFGNWTVLQVNRGDADNRRFVSLSFPGMIGVITGVAEDGIGVSEKVWYNAGAEDPPGSYDGEPDVFVLRDILQLSGNKEEAVDIMQNANRTWGIWVGAGDFASQQMNIVAYQQESAIAYTDQTITQLTGQPVLKDLVYVDKHAQPSGDTTFPQVLTDLYGTLSLETGPQATQFHGTGDIHIAFYDFAGTGNMIISIGRINAEGEYGPTGGDLNLWKAYNRPYLSFSLADLWTGN